MGLSIISNNCSGVRLMQDLKIRYDSPTVALQILPEEYTKFCNNLEFYLSQEIVEYRDFNDEHKAYLINMYGNLENITFPVGLCCDIILCFQHEESFETAKAKWDRRKYRVDYNNLAYIFCLDYDRYAKEAFDFATSELKNKFIFTRDFDIDAPHFRYSVPNNRCFLDKDREDHYYFEGEFRRESLWKNS